MAREVKVHPLIFGCLGTRLKSDEKAFFKSAAPWGFILFSRNLEEAGQIKALTDELQDLLGRSVPILIDQEGGRVQRLRAPLASDWPSPKAQIAGLSPSQALRVIWLRYRIIAAELRALGINVNCTPMVDLDHGGAHPIITDRVYGADPHAVAKLGRAVISAQSAGGVLSVVKHVPGHGRSAEDTHLKGAIIPDNLEALEADFIPFRALSDNPLAMVSHLIYRALDGQQPASQSQDVIAFIRENLGFKGVLMSDDLSMNALSGSVATRAARAHQAGCDIVLHCNGVMSEMEAIAAETSAMSPDVFARCEHALIGLESLPEAFSVEEGRVELRDIMAKQNGR